MAGVGETAALLAQALADGDVFYAADDEAEGTRIAHALAAAAPDSVVLFCPGSDALPGDEAPASPANVGERVAALRRARHRGKGIHAALVTTGEALARAYPEPEAFDAAPPCAKQGAELDLAALHAELIGLGYVADERVDEPGEVALRGAVLDVFPADAAQPLRIEVADGRVVAVRRYDPTDQRSTGEVEAQELGRVAEPSLEGKGVSLLAHLPDARVALAPEADERRRRFLKLAADAAKRRPGRALRDTLSEAAWTKALEKHDLLTIDVEGEAPPRFVEQRAPLRAFAKVAKAALAAGDRVVLLAGARDLRFLRPRIAEALGREIAEAASWQAVRDAQAGTLLALAMPVERGFRQGDVLAVAAADLIGSRAERGDTAHAPADAGLFDFGEIRVGDVVVHEDHGIAVVSGLEELPDGSGEAIVLTHAKDAKRLVPVAEADRLWRYGADAEAVTLDALDGHTWQKRRGAIDQAIAESARGLTGLAAERDKKTAPKLVPDPAAYERFASGFAFTETADQAKAIAAVRADLASGKPMDRLVVGDVGYGKTEVALRAAAVAALAGKQVAVAAPTTVLARQHLETFTARFDGSDIEVAGLSRLSSAAEKKRVKAGLADGSIGIVVGTGAVAGKGVAYKDLALVVIDEEQRFGAKDKAKLQALGTADGLAHLLALSATPIPRTLQSALVGIQSLSVIATPPARRQPIRTAVATFDLELVRTGLLRERARGGQSFVVVPRIEDMAPLAAKLAKAVPELEILEAHGKLPADEIDDVMVRFGLGDADVLLATNIIEAGLDVPRANTMVIWRADRFGLSQLHQLRGRVGRGGRRGQVLLLTDPDAEIAPRTLKRLRTLEAFDRLGAGFQIAARDLDMRGAGDLLGEAQAGHMKLIGVDLYQHLLESALRAARGEDVERWTPELHLEIGGRLPEAWVPDPELRVALYARLARAVDEDGVDALAEEMEDRFGAAPPEAATLLTIARIRARALAFGIARIDAGPAAIALTMRRGAELDGAAGGLAEKNGRWLLAERIEDAGARVERVAEVLDALG
jgi:transcription-repair coupling factor (superfamily II helicase)